MAADSIKASSFTERKNCVENMLLRVASSDAVVKSQQRGEPDLTAAEKVSILQKILDKSPGSFLMRFGNYLVEDDLGNFEHLIADYEIAFRVKEVEKALDTKKKKVGVRNRRFECLQRLMKNSDYFSEEQMRKRSPLLYEQYIGQYLSEEEKFERDKAEIGHDPSLSELLMSRQEKQMDEWLLEYQRDQENCTEEESESGSDTPEEEVETGSPLKGCPTEQEKLMLHEEFLSVMQDKFIRGEEQEFDYSTVDANTEYDDLKIRERDEEEQYFDSED
ncbi:coiled-coil domain-containing protein 97-like [Montipora capricornis]|uniref:coiled-coil domain-containing protein 97-like n=1 Tax=Montipora capricornis TaxID=246305 RepID=UPI0035F203D9